jgi:uncharacterized protein (TIGR02996 family)
MSEEDDFWKLLEEHPDDSHTRLVFADWLEERGDERAEGMRALGLMGVWADVYSFSDGPTYCLGTQANNNWQVWSEWSRRQAHLLLPSDWFVLIPEWNRHDWRVWRYRSTRREMEGETSRLFQKLPPDRRTELLSTATMASE